LQIKVSGLKEVEAQLIKLGSVEGTKVLRAAMLRAAKPIEDQAKANAGAIQNGSGALKLSIGKRFYVASGPKFFGLTLPALGGKFVVQVAPIRKSRVAVALYNMFYRRKRKGIFYGHLVEFGHRIGTSATGPLSRSRRGGRFTKRAQGDGRVAAHPFLSPALLSRSSEAVSSLAREIEKGIAALLSRK
jgi:hypothetical protein